MLVSSYYILDRNAIISSKERTPIPLMDYVVNVVSH
jgi:hypothetical protein